MHKLIDLTGQRFGRWAVVEQVENDKHCNTRWLCFCSCGEKRSVRADDLRSGKSRSCGCNDEYRWINLGTHPTHGESKTNEYRRWNAMQYRCLNTKGKQYKDYGGRGITICDRWLNSYENFLSDMGRCPEGLTIERIDNNGNYEPGNCKWATQKEQARNTRANVWLEFNGVRLILADWLIVLGITEGRWWRQIRNGLTKKATLQYFMAEKNNVQTLPSR